MVGTTGAIVGMVRKVGVHPNGERIWLSHVDLGDGGAPVQIVFGGKYVVKPEELVPVAPPGARVTVETVPLTAPHTKKMRARRYRGERSHGMLCSLNELGRTFDGPDEVATLRDVRPGDRLDGLPFSRRVAIVDRHRSLLVADQVKAHAPVPMT